MILSDETFQGFRQAKVLGANTSPSEIEYSTDGVVLAAVENGRLRLYSSLSGQVENIIHIDIQKLAFIYPHTLVHSTSNTLHLLSIFDNQYIRTFHGHECEVRAVSVCSADGSFLSASSECVNCWDVRKKSPVYRVNASELLGCMSSSNDYAVLINNSVLKIYDKKSTRGPKATIGLPDARYREMFYSPDASSLVMTSDRGHLVLDSQGSTRMAVNLERSSGCITPDSGYLLCCSGASVFVHSIQNKRKIHVFDIPSFDSTRIRFNPAHMQFTCASSFLNIWAVPRAD